MNYGLPLVFEPQPEGGYTVASPALPELVTEGDTVEDALENVRDALAAVIEIYRDRGRQPPPDLGTRHGKPAGFLIAFKSEDEPFEHRLENAPGFQGRIEVARQELKAGRGVRLEDAEG